MKIHEALMKMLPHQQRVIAEKIELDTRREALRLFIHTNKGYLELPAKTQRLLKDQVGVMGEYSHILSERILEFHPIPGTAICQPPNET